MRFCRDFLSSSREAVAWRRPHCVESASIDGHAKDSARFKGGWAFFASDGKAPARYIATTASCHSCHPSHGAVDTTFVQFYPTSIPPARANHTFDEADAAHE